MPLTLERLKRHRLIIEILRKIQGYFEVRADFHSSVLEEFRGLAWVPVQPKLLDYENTQILLIGEGADDDVSKALEPSRKDVKHGDKETPQEELEKLEHEDELRVQHLHGERTKPATVCRPFRLTTARR